MIVISDTSPITYLVQIGRLSLLRELFGSVVIPSKVFRELQASPVNFPATTTAINEGWMQIQAPLGKLSLGPDENLDDGEAEAIALALELKADLVLIDEQYGTLIARKLNLQTFGLLAVLVEAKQKGLLAAVRPVLDNILKLGFKLSPNLYKQILSQINE